MTKQPERVFDEPAEKDIDADVTSATAPTRAKAEQPKEASSDEGIAPLFDESEAKDLRSRWDSIQAGFVDQPGQSVERADELVSTVINRLSEVFSIERKNLEQGWASADDVSTEDLRIALRRYRSFFDRLLSV